MSWITENNFIEGFLEMYNCELRPTMKKNVTIWREVETGYGRPDIALIEFSSDILFTRYQKMEKCLPSISNLATYAMGYLYFRRWVKVETLRSFLNCSKNNLRTIIYELHTRQLIVAKEDLIKARPRKEILAINKITVFEAKLTQWKGAVDQAERNLWFTNDSYILMPQKNERLSRSIINECDRRGIGIGFFGLETGIRYALHPEKSGIINTPLLWNINEGLLDTYDKGSEIFAGFSNTESSIPRYSH